ncbi:Hypothetical protein FP0594 [Flavobacterium psychrophilum JIP02/86]|uniref:Uncharacterized protein n=1 Tax=Flavobacterium psychrophilum (strain ATCC 49511 / DSM 21280 / CIP 103535 / JIP02/86) TaxID=402612 RepID=A6GX76_FLAPJ|nr:hypothetical protein [Flavobacterium psychrophilum]QGS63560.1 hypothetical protein GMY06_06895 [Flavobacterium psychrophilum]CAL42699.1 Hypothetical protein FP0594 [Flavobacterium psychrophilum JIP02/86]
MKFPVPHNENIINKYPSISLYYDISYHSEEQKL